MRSIALSIYVILGLFLAPTTFGADEIDRDVFSVVELVEWVEAAVQDAAESVSAFWQEISEPAQNAGPLIDPLGQPESAGPFIDPLGQSEDAGPLIDPLGDD